MSDIKNELTTEHDIYISIGLKHPMKPTDCRDLIDSLIVDNFTLNSWGTHTKDEWIDVVNECQEKVDSLVTTIESQQREIQRIESENKGYLHSLKLKRDEIESQKEKENKYTEMLLSIEASMMKFLSLVNIHIDTHQSVESQAMAVTEFLERQKSITELAVKGLKDISSMRSYKVDWESYTDYEKLCGVEDVANNTLTEIARLSHEQT